MLDRSIRFRLYRTLSRSHQTKAILSPPCASEFGELIVRFSDKFFSRQLWLNLRPSICYSNPYLHDLVDGSLTNWVCSKMRRGRDCFYFKCKRTAKSLNLWDGGRRLFAMMKETLLPEMRIKVMLTSFMFTSQNISIQQWVAFICIVQTWLNSCKPAKRATVDKRYRWIIDGEEIPIIFHLSIQSLARVSN